MSSEQDKKATTDPSGSKHAAPGDNTQTKPNEARRSSSGGHEETGPERFASAGGSGGVPLRTGQGYESLAQH